MADSAVLREQIAPSHSIASLAISLKLNRRRQFQSRDTIPVTASILGLCSLCWIKDLVQGKRAANIPDLIADCLALRIKLFDRRCDLWRNLFAMAGQARVKSGDRLHEMYGLRSVSIEPPF